MFSHSFRIFFFSAKHSEADFHRKTLKTFIHVIFFSLVLLWKDSYTPSQPVKSSDLVDFFFYVHNEWAKKSRITKIKRTTNNLEINVCVWVYMVLLHMCLQFRYGTYTYGAISTFNKSSSYRLIAFIIGWTKKNISSRKKIESFHQLHPMQSQGFILWEFFLLAACANNNVFLLHSSFPTKILFSIDIRRSDEKKETFKMT